VADYTLPHLPYDYATLEPHISGKIMELHHSNTTPPTSRAPTPPWSSWPTRGNAKRWRR
jgi:hypothetical protein